MKVVGRKQQNSPLSLQSQWGLPGSSLQRTITVSIRVGAPQIEAVFFVLCENTRTSGTLLYFPCTENQVDYRRDMAALSDVVISK